MKENPVVTMKIKDLGDILIELCPDVAPNTVSSFAELVASGFYNGLTFHRVISGFMIQGGCPHGSGTGGPGFHIKGEFGKNGVDNSLKHNRGVISMARSSHPDSAGSQFFLMHENSPHLDGGYAAFGKVVSGLEIIDKIANLRTDFSDRPLEPVIIESAAIDLKGNELSPAERTAL